MAAIEKRKKEVLHLYFEKTQNTPASVAQKLRKLLKDSNPTPNEYGYDISVLYHRNKPERNEAFRRENDEYSYAFEVFGHLYASFFKEEKAIRSFLVDEVYDREGSVEIEITWENN